MKLGIMQPYFFPYLGYFDLINYSDKWIVFDDVQYIRHGWVNRNRVLHPSAGWSYLIVPVSYHRGIQISEVNTVDDGKWKIRILGQLRHYKKEAAYYRETVNLVEDCLSFDSRLISRINVYALEKVCSYIGIDFSYSFFSEMDLKLESVDGHGDWALRISQTLGAREYVNPPGGEVLFDKEKFMASNIKLTIRNLPALMYDCPGYTFMPNLSIIDILMWNAPEKIKKYLHENNDNRIRQ